LKEETSFPRSGNRTFLYQNLPCFLSRDVKEEAKEKDEKVNNPQQNDLRIKLIEESKHYQKLPSEEEYKPFHLHGRSSMKRPANIKTILYGSCAHR
jgi:hypothetical protein